MTAMMSMQIAWMKKETMRIMRRLNHRMINDINIMAMRPRQDRIMLSWKGWDEPDMRKKYVP